MREISPILQHPDPTLRQVSMVVMHFDSSLADLVARMSAAINASHVRALGLAAIQIGEPKRVIVLVQGSQHVAMVNPRITRSSGVQAVEDGCLSVKFGTYFRKRTRPAFVLVEYQDLTGQPCRRRAKGIHAAAIAHELDHLEGKLFIDELQEAA